MYLVLIKIILRVLLRADDSASLVNHYTLHCTEVKVRMIGEMNLENLLRINIPYTRVTTIWEILDYQKAVQST